MGLGHHQSRNLRLVKMVEILGFWDCNH